MWIHDKLRDWHTARAQRYLTRHPDLGLQVLRRDHELAARAFEHFSETQAASGQGGPQRDSYQYPLYMGMAYAGRTPIMRTLPKPAPWNVRNFANAPPARRAINALSNPILELPFTITLRRPLGAKAHDVQPETTEDQHVRIVAATEMLTQPNDDMDGRTFLEMVLEDLLVFGAGPFEVEANRSDNRPLFLWPVDSQSIRINMQWTAGSDTFRYSQGKGVLFGSLGVGDEVHFTDEQLCYPRLNPTTATPFGYGYVEIAYETINSFLGAFQFATRRASNEIPPFGLFLGENQTPEQVRRFQHYWENEIEGRGKIPILGGGRQPSAFNFSAGNARDPLWIQWQEWQIRILAMCFGLSPMKLGIERDVNRSTAQVQASDDWGTIAPVANIIKSCFTHWVLWKRLGWRDLEFQWQVKSSDELRQANILAMQYSMNCITIDEIRQVYERPPLPDGLGDMVRSPFEAAVKAAAGGGGNPGEDFEDPALPKPPRITGATVHPFGDIEPEHFSPGERAFLRELAARVAMDEREDAVAG